MRYDTALSFGQTRCGSGQLGQEVRYFNVLFRIDCCGVGAAAQSSRVPRFEKSEPFGYVSVRGTLKGEETKKTSTSYVVQYSRR